MEDVVTTIFFFFCEVRYSLLESNSWKKKTPTYDKLEELE